MQVLGLFRFVSASMNKNVGFVLLANLSVLPCLGFAVLLEIILL